MPKVKGSGKGSKGKGKGKRKGKANPATELDVDNLYITDDEDTSNCYPLVEWSDDTDSTRQPYEDDQGDYEYGEEDDEYVPP